MALLSFKTLSVYIIARLATLTARQKSSWAWVTCFLLQFRLREIIIFDDSFRFASDEDQLLILDPLSTAVVILCLIYSRIYLIFSNSLSLTNTVFNGQMVFLFGAMRLLLMILMTLFWSSVLLFRKDTHTPSYPDWLVSGLHVTVSWWHPPTCQMSPSGPLFSVLWSGWHCRSVEHPAPYLSRSHPQSSDSGSGVMPSNIVPRARTSELELLEKGWKSCLNFPNTYRQLLL